MAEDLLVIQGGKLIDGTGRRPIEDSVIVMKAGKFKAIGRRGEVPTYSDMHVVFKYRDVSLFRKRRITHRFFWVSTTGGHFMLACKSHLQLHRHQDQLPGKKRSG
jgi:hypothetical protein